MEVDLATMASAVLFVLKSEVCPAMWQTLMKTLMQGYVARRSTIFTFRIDGTFDGQVEYCICSKRTVQVLLHINCCRESPRRIDLCESTWLGNSLSLQYLAHLQRNERTMG